MTWEEAIAILEESKRQNQVMRDNPTTFWASYQMTEGVENSKNRIAALDLALAALRPVSREQVEKVWRRCEWCNGEHSNNGEISAYAEVECEGCDAGDNCPNAHSSDDPCYGMVDRSLAVNFCPVCGCPLTDEAVEMVMGRLEALHDAES